MKIGSVLLTVAVALIGQAGLARYAIGGRWQIDLVLVGVVYAAIYWGPVAGIGAGTIGGLAQDLLSHGIVGVGGLSKTIVGFGAGALASQFIVTRPHVRVAVVAAATFVQRLMVLVIYALIDQRWSGVPWTAMLGEIVFNALAALVAFQVTEALPGALARRRTAGRSNLSRRIW